MRAGRSEHPTPGIGVHTGESPEARGQRICLSLVLCCYNKRTQGRKGLFRLTLPGQSGNYGVTVDWLFLSTSRSVTLLSPGPRDGTAQARLVLLNQLAIRSAHRPAGCRQSPRPALPHPHPHHELLYLALGCVKQEAKQKHQKHSR